MSLVTVLAFSLLLAHRLGAQDAPVLVIGTSSNAFGQYHTEILLAEGLNSFSYTDISSVTAGMLSTRDVVILGEMALNSTQATMFGDWVDSGGNLIAMRPDQNLTGLLGLVSSGGTLSDAYLRVETSASPGAGIVGETMQFHGAADLYSVAGATVVASLYTDAVTATTNPAVTIRDVGINGGQAAAFMFDLGQSVVYTRQGNPAWEGQDRDGLAPIRSNDLFYGAATFDLQPDWVDLTKVAIPQADEQQRLLANLILHMNQNNKPLPRFWYFPFDNKAAVVMTGDDHGNNGTAGRFDSFISASSSGCSVDDWECIRGTSYIYPNTPITSTQANSYEAQGFEIAIHLNTNCADFTAGELDEYLTDQLAAMAANFPGVPASTTNRNHCISYSDWDSLPLEELNHGIRLDTTYYFYPPTWVNNAPGFFTGSGFPMRFAALDGTLIDVYQATTQMTDESVQTYPFTIDTLLDRAIGPLGYYGAFTANIHTDSSINFTQDISDQIVASAQARNVPVVTARQLLRWVDARNGSSFSSLSWAGSVVSFSISADPAANGLRALLPTASLAGGLVTLSRNGIPIVYSTEVIKGSEYAVFDALDGLYDGTYSATPMTISVTPPSAILAESETEAFDALVTGVGDTSVTWSADPNVGTLTLTGPSSVQYEAPGITTGALSVDVTATSVANPSQSAIATVNLVTSGTGGLLLQDTTDADFGAGSGAGAYISNSVDGEVTLQPTVGEEFTDPTLPPGWTVTPWNTGGAVSASGGALQVDGARFGADAVFGPGRTLEFVATYGADRFHYVGLGTDFNAAPWIILGTVAGSTELFARTNDGAQSLDTPLGGAWLGVPNLYRIEWNSTSVVYYINGLEVANHPFAPTASLRPLVSDYLVGGAGVAVDWIRVSPYSASATFSSRVFDAAATVTWGSISWVAATPADSALSMSVRVGDTPTPDPSWSAFVPAPVSGTVISASSRYIQYEAQLSASSDLSTAPDLSEVVILSTTPISSVGVAGISMDSATVTWTTSDLADSQVEYGETVAYGQSTALDPTLVTSHNVALTGLNPGTLYHFRVRSRDTQSALWFSDDFVFTTQSPPVISGVSGTAGLDSATITWSTDTPSDSRIDYGPSPTSLTLSVSDASLVTSHNLTMTGLSNATTYFYRVISTDAQTNSAVFPDPPAAPASIATLDPNPAVISSINALSGVQGSAAIRWTTNKLADSRVDYGVDPETLTLSVSDGTLTTDHALVLTGLVQGTQYYYRVTSVDSLSNLTVAPGGAQPPASFVQNAISVWDAQATPTVISDSDTRPIEVGVKFRTAAAGVATGVMFYKGPANTGLHVGSLWAGDGTLLASAEFSYETASGWQEVFFSNPVNLAADTTYVVSYLAPVGSYSLDEGYFASSGASNGPLTALAEGVDGSNGLYQLSSTTVFPDRTFNSSNYWVDVLFVDNLPPAIANVGVTSGSPTATATWTTDEPADARIDYGTSAGTLDQSVSSAVVGTSQSLELGGLTPTTTYFYRVTSLDAWQNGTTVPPLTDPPSSFTTGDGIPPIISGVSAVAGSTAAAITWATSEPANSRVEYGVAPTALTQTVSNPALASSHGLVVSGLTPATTYYYRAISLDADGNTATFPEPPAAPLTFTTSGGGGGGGGALAIWPTDTPTVVEENDPSSVELGVKFRSGSAGEVIGVRFYKGLGNTGEHIGNLWASDGTLLATVTFANETASGWQEAFFSNPVRLAPETTYVISYFAPNGRYSVDSGFFAATGASNGVLTALAEGTDGSNGLYQYGASSAFPEQSFNSGNYWVDVLFVDTAPLISGLTASAGGDTASIEWATDEPANSRVDYGTSPATLDQSESSATFAMTHSLSLTALSPLTTYYYRVTSADPSLNAAVQPLATDPPLSFTTNNGTPPVISAVNATPGNSSALVTWTTDVPSDSKVVYGASPGVLDQSASHATLTTAHSVALGGLSPTTIYYYRVISAKADNNSATFPDPPAPELTFTTSGGGGGSGALSIWPTGTPAVVEENDPSSLELGVKFHSSSAGDVIGVRFYKGSGNTGSHIGNLWASDGTLLATVAFANETASGWQEAFFSNPVSIAANTTYVASYFAPAGRYSVDNGYFAGQGASNGPLTALEEGVDGSNGLYQYGAASAFPDQSYNSGNYWVDVLFIDTVPTISAVGAAAGGANATVTWSTNEGATSRVDYGTSPTALAQSQTSAALVASHHVLLTDLSPLTTYYYRVTSEDSSLNAATHPLPTDPPLTFTTNNGVPPLISGVSVIPGNTTALVTWTTDLASDSRVRFGTSPGTLDQTAADGTLVTAHAIALTGLTPSTTYYYQVSSTEAQNNTAEFPEAPASLMFATSGGGGGGALSIWPSGTPTVVEENDSSSVELGVKFQSSSAGDIIGVRFYKGLGNTGAHVGNLWAANGTLLATVAFSSETATGWQESFLSNPVRILPNTTYVVSYFAPDGGYSVDSGFFAASGTGNGVLTALAEGVDGPNGVYQYSASSAFPDQSFNSSNYWVDVLFIDTAPLISGVTAFAGGQTASIDWTTDEPATSRVDYGTSPSTLDQSVTLPAFTTSHSVALTGLSPLTTYYYRVTSADPSLNSATQPLATDPPSSFTTSDGLAPTISGVAVTSDNVSALVTWTTDVAAHSQVVYGTSPGTLDQIAADAALVTAHAVALNGLTPSTTYFYRVTSAEAGGASSTFPQPPAAPQSFATTNVGSPPSEWDISGAGDPTIQGFTTDISYNIGETARFKIDTDATAYHLEIYRMGYYDGDGAQRVATVNPSAALPQVQPSCLDDPATGLIDCGNWTESASWDIPASATSGIYFAKAVRDSGLPGASHIVFVVRDDSSTSEIVFQTSDTTWQAYNQYGGNSLYVGSPAGRAYKVSYNRPFTTREYAPEDWVFNSEYPMVRWLEANGYDVTYTTDIDTDRRGGLLTNHKVFMSVGHDEYWSAAQRANIEAARDAGLHLAFFSGNEVFWKTRWENSISAQPDSYRTLTCYKETLDNAKIDPSTEWTGTWRDPRFSPPADGGLPENALTGTIFTVNCCTYAIEVPEADGKMRFWRNTAIANLSPGQTATLPDGTLGYEWDEDLDNGFRPAGTIRLSQTSVDVPQKLQDFGSTYGPGTAVHALTLYRHSGGALVFGAGSIQWSWGLDSNHDRGGTAPDVRMQQATVNLFADMGVQPTSLQAGLVPAVQSADSTAPTSAIVSPADGSNVTSGTPITIAGTAVDGGGGIVGGVEISVDGGATWNRANGRSSWDYDWTPTGSGSVTIVTRATDDSANIQSAPTSATVNVQ